MGVARALLKSNGQQKLQNAISALNAAKGPQITATNTAISTLKAEMGRLSPELKAESDKFKETRKTLAREFNDLEKSASKALASDEKSWRSTISAETKKSNSYFKGVEKEFGSTEKGYEREVKRLDGEADKQIKTLSKQVMKDAKGLEKTEDGLKRQLNKLFEGYEDATAKGGEISSDMEKAIGKLMDSTDSGSPGLNVAQERSEEEEERAVATAESQLDDLEAQSTLQLSEVGGTLQQLLKNNEAQQAKTMSEADSDVLVFSSQAEAALAQFADSAGELQTGIDRKLASEEKEEQKVTQSYAQTQTALDDSINQGATEVEDLKTAVNEKIGQYEDFTKQKLNAIDDSQTQYVEEQERKLLDSVRKSVKSLLGEHAIATGSIATTFANELGAVVARLNTEQAKLDEQHAAKDGVATTLATIAKGLESMEERANGLPSVASDMRTSVRAILDKLHKDCEDLLEKVLKSEEENAAFMQKQTASAQTLASKTRDDFTSHLQEQRKEVTRKLTALSDASTDADHKTQSMAQAVQAKVSEVSSTLKAVEDEIRSAVQSVSEMRRGSDEQMVEAEETAQRMQRESTAKGETLLKEVRTYGEKTVQETEGKLEGELQAASLASTDAASNVQAAIHAATSKQMEQAQALDRELKLSADKLRVLNGTLSNEEAQLTADNETRSESLADTYKKVMALKASAEKERADTEGGVTKMVSGARGQFVSDGDALLADLVGDVHNALHDADQTFQRDYDSARTGLQGSEVSTQKLIDSAKNEYSQVHMQDEDFKRWLQTSGEKAGNAVVTAAQGTLQAIHERDTAVDRVTGEINTDSAKTKAEMLAQIQSARDASSSALSQTEHDVAQEAAAATQAARDSARKTEREYADVGHEIADAANAAGAADQELQGQISQERNQVQSDYSKIEGEINLENQAVSEEQRHEQGELSAWALQQQRENAKTNDESQKIELGISKQSDTVKQEVRDMVALLRPMLARLDPSGRLASGKASVAQLEHLISHAQRVLAQKEGSVEHGIMDAVDRAGAVKRMTDAEEAAVNTAIVSAARTLQEKFGEVHERFTETSEGVEALVSDMQGLSGELEQSTKARIGSVLTDLDKTQADVEDALTLEQYQSEDSVKKVMKVVDESQNQTDRLAEHQTEVIMPSIAAWRGEVEKVFEDLGMGLDLERVARMAAESEAAEGENSAILSAEQELKMKVKKIADATAAKTRAVWSEAEKRIAAINAMEHLSAEQKAALIAQVKAEAQAAADALMEKARKLMAEQSTMKHNIELSMSELDGLMARAEQLATSHDGSAESHALVLQLMADLQAKIRQLRQRYVVGDSGYSLLEEPDTGATQQYKAAEEHLRILDAQRKPEDAQLDTVLSLMEKGLPQLRS